MRIHWLVVGSPLKGPEWLSFNVFFVVSQEAVEEAVELSL